MTTPTRRLRSLRSLGARRRKEIDLSMAKSTKRVRITSLFLALTIILPSFAANPVDARPAPPDTGRPVLPDKASRPPGDIYSVEYWRSVAYQQAGVTPWNPDDGLARNFSTIQSVYNYYGKLYTAYPELYWAGLAKMAGAVFFAGFQDLERIAEIHESGEDVEPLLRDVLGTLDLEQYSFPVDAGVFDYVVKEFVDTALDHPLALIDDDARLFLRELLRMQKRIFDDMSWQHEAFLYGERTKGMGGVKLLKAIASRGAFPEYPTVAARHAYVDNSWGNVTNNPGQALKVHVLREQRTIIQGLPGFPDNPLGGYNWFLSSVSGKVFLEASSLWGGSVVPGGTPFRSFPQRPFIVKPDWAVHWEIWGNIGVWDYRSIYILNVLLPEAAAYLANPATATAYLSDDVVVLAEPHRFPLLSMTPTEITFDEVPLGTVITDQYINRGVVFAAHEKAFTTSDGANVNSPVLSGTPLFSGPIRFRLVSPSDASVPRASSNVAFDIGYLNADGGVVVSWFDRAGNLMGYRPTVGTGIQRFVIVGDGIHEVEIRYAGDPWGFAVDNLAT